MGGVGVVLRMGGAGGTDHWGGAGADQGWSWDIRVVPMRRSGVRRNCGGTMWY